MIIPCRLMLKSQKELSTVDCKIFCNRVEYPFVVINHGLRSDVYQKTDLYFTSVSTAFVCADHNELAILWTKPAIDIEIDDIELDYLFIDKPMLFSASSFYHTISDQIEDPPREFNNNYWSSGTLINNPGIFYMNFDLPINQWSFNDRPQNN